MAKYSDLLMNGLTEFTVCEIGSKVMDGITYTLLLKNEKDQELYNKYMRIKQEACNCGYVNDEVFRVYELCNGYIMDADLEAVKRITSELAKNVSAKTGNKNLAQDLIKDMPDQRRKRDIVSLAKYLKSEYDKGKRELEVALFSRNASNKIVITGQTPNGDYVSIRYNAYAIRHWDIEIINDKFLIPAGFRVKSIRPCEILPSRTGVSFLFRLESMEEYNTNNM